MLLLLAGASDTARGLLAESFLGDHPNWKHLALEDIYDPEQATADDFQTAFNTIVACECVRDARKAGECPVLITCPSATMLETVQEEFPSDLVCVRLGVEQEWEGHSFDHEVNAKKCSLKEIGGFLRKLAKA
ncbi:hypothetical protein FJZ27_00255 [Candidatus Peribacteria bacterium]|nr:hypothetical protein [Candidatus Peribacteria bacterium]